MRRRGRLAGRVSPFLTGNLQPSQFARRLTGCREIRLLDRLSLGRDGAGPGVRREAPPCHAARGAMPRSFSWSVSSSAGVAAGRRMPGKGIPTIPPAAGSSSFPISGRSRGGIRRPSAPAPGRLTPGALRTRKSASSVADAGREDCPGRGRAARAPSGSRPPAACSSRSRFPHRRRRHGAWRSAPVSSTGVSPTTRGPRTASRSTSPSSA